MKRNVFFICCLFFFFLAMGTAVPASADQIILQNGDIITGEVTKAENGSVSISTEYSKPVVVQQGAIRSLTTQKSITLLLESGEVLKGKVATGEDGMFYIEASPERERIVIDWMSVKAINPPPSRWKGNITVGGSLESGNTDRSSLSIGAETSRKTEKDRFTIRFLFNYSEENDVLAARNTYGSLKYDYFFYPELYGYLATEMLKDRFRDLNLRTVAGSGLGYQVWDDEIKSLSFEMGITYFSEDHIRAEDNNYASGRLNADFSWTIAGAITASEEASFYPSLENSKYLLRNVAGLAIPAGAGWSFSIMNIFEHDSMPPSDVRKNNLQWILALQYAF